MVESAIWVAAGGVIGTLGRYWISALVAYVVGGVFPWGTVIIDISDSFFIAFYGTLTGPDGRLMADPVARQFVMIGFSGGYTTFSSFSLQTLQLAQSGEWGCAGANVVLSLALCLAAAWLGYVSAASINHMRGG